MFLSFWIVCFFLNLFLFEISWMALSHLFLSLSLSPIYLHLVTLLLLPCLCQIFCFYIVLYTFGYTGFRWLLPFGALLASRSIFLSLSNSFRTKTEIGNEFWNTLCTFFLSEAYSIAPKYKRHGIVNIYSVLYKWQGIHRDVIRNCGIYRQEEKGWIASGCGSSHSFVIVSFFSPLHRWLQTSAATLFALAHDSLTSLNWNATPRSSRCHPFMNTYTGARRILNVNAERARWSSIYIDVPDCWFNDHTTEERRPFMIGFTVCTMCPYCIPELPL